MTHPRLSDERGIALITVLLLTLALGALALGAAMVSMNAGLIRRYGERLTVSGDAGLAGAEEGRSRLNANPGTYPDTGYVTLEGGGAVTDASGAVLSGVRRWTWAGPSGVSSGQFGVFGSVISLVKDSAGITTVRRLEVNQESFAKFAYFTDIEPSNISFGGGDQIFGPVHTNDFLKIYPSGARFRDDTRTGKTVVGAQYGTFDKGYTENVPRIEMPTVPQLTKLQAQAQTGNTYFPGFTTGAYGQARTRVEFVALDLNGDGDTTDPDEGFIKVYQSAVGNEDFTVATRPATITTTPSCGDRSASHGGAFLATVNHSTTGVHNRAASLNDVTTHCYLGGDTNLTNGFVISNADGSWLPWGGPVDPRVTALMGTEASYLHPITRPLNPNFKGVIYVNGKVAISGTLRGRVTLVSPQSIILADNVKQATDPAAGVCEDILGVFAGGDIIVADNLLNAPVNVAGSTWRTLRPAGNGDEVIHAVVLTLNIFTVQNYSTGPTTKEPCGIKLWGRGCLALTGGIIQRTRGAVGTTAGTGNLKRYSYNACAFTDPPPYFPTTGRFARSRFYEIDPTGFNVATWFTRYQQ